METSTDGAWKVWAAVGVVGGVAVIAILLWGLGGLAASVKGSDEQVLARLIAAKSDERDPMVIELGRRGVKVIPGIVAAYRKAEDDPVLRTHLVMIIRRIGPVGEAKQALQDLGKEEKDGEVKDLIERHLADLNRMSR
ncbi:MAG: hypothetical protein KA354_01510 [Phycisphaerae bacterium]|nr:hypothetical protein [Phycisphaerae bacterium]